MIHARLRPVSQEGLTRDSWATAYVHAVGMHPPIEWYDQLYLAASMRRLAADGAADGFLA